MTKIIIFKRVLNITGFQIKGHSGFGEEGNDIVCSGISTASQMAVVALKEVLKLEFEMQIRDGFIFVHLKEEDYDNPYAQCVLNAMEKTLEDICKNYARFVKMEVKKDVY